MKSKKVYFVQFAALLALFALPGCMTSVKARGNSKGQDSSVIRTRAVERWDLLIAHKAEKAWDYLSPGYRKTKARGVYAQEMNARGIRWSKVYFGSQQCDADTCNVHLSVDYTLNLGGPAGDTKSLGFLVETWIKAKGHWYFLPEQFGPAGLGKESGKDS